MFVDGRNKSVLGSDVSCTLRRMTPVLRALPAPVKPGKALLHALPEQEGGSPLTECTDSLQPPIPSPSPTQFSLNKEMTEGGSQGTPNV